MHDHDWIIYYGVSRFSRLMKVFVSRAVGIWFGSTRFLHDFVRFDYQVATYIM